MTKSFAIACLALAACSPHRIDVRIVHSRALVPEEAFGRVTLRIEEAESGRAVHEGSVEGAALASAATLFDATELETGSRYVAVLIAEADGVCGRGRAVGRSTPFAHEEGDYAVTIQVGCADEFTLTAGRPEVPRMAHRLVTTADGDAMLIGGAARVQFEAAEGTLPFEGITATTERYDPATGRFVPAGFLVSPRIVPAAVPLPGGAIAVIGGTGPSLPACETSIELVEGLSSATAGSLARARCWPSAVFLPGPERVVVLGGQMVDGSNALDRGLDGEAYDAALRTRVAERVSGQTYTASPRVIPLADGESALVVGGVTSYLPRPVASRLYTGGGCADAACTEPIEMEDAPADGLANMAATYVPCTGGGGAVYVLGGESGAMDATVARTEAWCYRDVPGASGTVVRAGSIPDKRAQAVAVTVDGSRILLIGGTPNDSTVAPDFLLPHEDALLISVDGCACSAIDPGAASRVPLPLDGLAVMHDATVLDDGSVLVVGGLRITLGSRSAAATGESVLFVPDVAP